MNPEISLSTGRYQRVVGDRQAIEIAADIGCDAIDFQLDGNSADKPDSAYALGSEERTFAYFDSLRRLAGERGIRICQTHGRMRGFSFDERADARLVRDARMDMLATKALGAPYCVIHSVTSIHAGFRRAPEEMRAANLAMYRAILPFAREFDVCMALETFGDATDGEGVNGCDFFGDPAEFTRAYREISADPQDRAHMCLCVDTGHTNKAARFGHPLPGALIRTLGSDVKLLHLNDNDGVADQHKIPLTGTIDWDDVMAALAEIGYGGAYNMELHLDAFGKDLGMMKETGRFALRVMRSLLASRSEA